MQILNKILLPLAILFLPLIAFADGTEFTINKQKMRNFTTAVAHAEGFGQNIISPPDITTPAILNVIPNCQAGVPRLAYAGQAREGIRSLRTMPRAGRLCEHRSR